MGKSIEGRDNGPWIRSRLFNKDGSKKHYDRIKYYNGPACSERYPTTEMKFEGFHQVTEDFTIGPYYNKMIASFRAGSWMILQSPLKQSTNEKNTTTTTPTT
jgi:hypothetical protein